MEVFRARFVVGSWLVLLLAGCELIASPDRSLIDSDGDGGPPGPGDGNTATLEVAPATTSANRLVTTEEGTTARFTVRLGARPTSAVQLELASSAPDEGVVTPVSVAFTPDDWELPRTVTVRGVADGVADGDQRYEIRFASVTSTDARFNGLAHAPVLVLNLDIDDGDGGDAGDGGKTCTALLGAPPPAIGLRTDNTGLALIDLDKDNVLDAVIASRQSRVVSVLLGNGNGSFKPRVDYAAGVNSADVAVGDLNGDGKADVVATSAPNGAAGAVSVLLGNGDGTLQAKVDYATGQGTLTVALAKLDGDAVLDVVAVNSTDNTVSVLVGNGDGTFQGKVDYATGTTPGAVAVADVDGDGKNDVVVVSGTGSTVSVLRGNGDGTLQAKVDYTTDTQPTGLALGDLNGDGKPDIVTSNSTGAVNPSVLSVLLNAGDGTFLAKSSLATGRFPSAVRLADMDGDTKLDIVCAAAGADAIAVHRGNGDGTFVAPQSFTTGAGTGPSMLAVGKLRGAARPDVFALLGATDQATVLSGCP